MSIIKDIRAREILDSRGQPTIEVRVITTNSVGIASVPAGASTGSHEAKELRDGGKRYKGLGVQKAIKNVHTIIAPLLKSRDCTQQTEIDSLMIERDGSKDKYRLGANAILAVSLACAKAAAASHDLSLYKYLARLPQLADHQDRLRKNKSRSNKQLLPRAYFNVINGGKHATSQLQVQECMIVPHLSTFHDNLRAASEIYHLLKTEIHRKYGLTGVGDEGGFAPPLKTTDEALTLLRKVIVKAGYNGKVDLAIDCAASSFYKNKKYHFDEKIMSADQLLEHYLKLIKKFKIISIEDPFAEEDFAHFALLKRRAKIQVVGDDLTVTNPGRIKIAIEQKSCNCLLLKVNQIGTLTEALEAARLAFNAGWDVMVSHRSGETEDTFIADLAAALGCGQIKAGAPCRGERVAKYNRLLEIEEEIK